MKVSRRDFLYGAVSTAGVCAWPRVSGAQPTVRADKKCGCVIIDARSHCTLRESLEGYGGAVGHAAECLAFAQSDVPLDCRWAIVPGFAGADVRVCAFLLHLLERGTNVLVESSGAFASPSEFTAHRRMMRDWFDLEVTSPLHLWAPTNEREPHVRRRSQRQVRNVWLGTPLRYVEYRWPRPAWVRDFSRAVPVEASHGDVVGQIGGSTVAVKKRIADGTLVFLGSPLGPVLRAGDREALDWLQSVLL